jgi:hypothetical protein
VGFIEMLHAERVFLFSLHVAGDKPHAIWASRMFMFSAARFVKWGRLIAASRDILRPQGECSNGNDMGDPSFSAP